MDGYIVPILIVSAVIILLVLSFFLRGVKYVTEDGREFIIGALFVGLGAGLLAFMFCVECLENYPRWVADGPDWAQWGITRFVLFAAIVIGAALAAGFLYLWGYRRRHSPSEA